MINNMEQFKVDELIITMNYDKKQVTIGNDGPYSFGVMENFDPAYLHASIVISGHEVNKAIEEILEKIIEYQLRQQGDL